MAKQLTLEFEPGLLDRHACLREVLVAGIYRRGLSNVADDLGKAPGNLSRELAGDSDRHFSVESMELYIKKHHDLEPIYYLVAKYIGDNNAVEGAALQRVEELMQQVAALLPQAGQKKSQARR